MIQELSSTTFDDYGNSNDDIVTAAVSALVEHYSQPIHVETTLQYHDAFHQKDDDNEMPAIVQLQLDRILQQSSRQQEQDSNALLMNRLLSMYESKIRPAFLSFPSPKRTEERRPVVTSTGIAVVVHYEMLVTGYLRRQTRIIRSDDGDSSCSNTDVNRRRRRRRLPAFDNITETLNEMIETLACDVTTVQAQQQEHGSDNKKNSYQKRIVLVSLLKLLNSALELAANTSNSSFKMDQSVARRCVCTLLALDPKRSCLDMDVSIHDALLDMSFYSACPPPPPKNHNSSIAFKIPQSVLEFVGLAVSDDNNDNSGSKTTGNTFTELLPKQLLSLAWKNLAVICNNDNNKNGNSAPADNEFVSDKELQYSLWERLDIEEVAKAVRAHFFARDLLPQDAAAILAKPKQRLHLGRTVDEQQDEKDSVLAQKPHQVNPSRLCAALNFLSLLQDITWEILDQVLPIIYELLNSSSDDLIGWGAASLYHLLKISSIDDENSATSRCRRLWTTGPIADNLLALLDQTIKTCRHGPTLALLGLAQRQLFQCVMTFEPSYNNNDDAYIHKRRKATQQWLLILQRNNLHVTKDDLVWGLLVGGIVPLLYDHATCTSAPADALEIGRLGLSALLPVLRGECGYDNFDDGQQQQQQYSVVDDDAFQGIDGDDVSEKATSKERNFIVMSVAVQMAALTALSNLMIAAHPIMPRHAGKIVCELLAFLRRHRWPGDDIDDNNKERQHSHLLSNVKQLALHVTATSIVICGDPAMAVLDRVTDGFDKKGLESGDSFVQYDEELVKVAKIVRGHAATLARSNEAREVV